jgi:hypothetical protein
MIIQACGIKINIFLKLITVSKLCFKRICLCIPWSILPQTDLTQPSAHTPDMDLLDSDLAVYSLEPLAPNRPHTAVRPYPRHGLTWLWPRSVFPGASCTKATSQRRQLVSLAWTYLTLTSLCIPWSLLFQSDLAQPSVCTPGMDLPDSNLALYSLKFLAPNRSRTAVRSYPWHGLTWLWPRSVFPGASADPAQASANTPGMGLPDSDLALYSLEPLGSEDGPQFVL